MFSLYTIIMEKIIILGAGVMQGPAIKIAKELGLCTVVIDGSKSAVNANMADQFVHIDLKDKEGIEAFARTLDGLKGIITAGTDFSATVAWVAERLGLPGIPYEAALNASDKARMRECFDKAGLPSPQFITIDKTYIQQSSIPNSSFLTPHSPLIPHFPLVVKPVDNMGGRGCRRVNTMEEFYEAAEDALRYSRSGRAIVEAFMDGPEFSVDAIVYHGEISICGLADRHIYFPPYFIEMGHTMPAIIAVEQQAALLDTFCAGVRALGLAAGNNIGAAKGDIKLTENGPMIGEIAARLSGGYMSGWTYPYSSGIEPVRAAILAAVGRKPENLAPIKTWTSAERAFISIPGTIKEIAGTEEAQSQPHVKDLFFRIKEGDSVDFPHNNVSKCGNVISAAPDRESAVQAAEDAVRSILICLDPDDSTTADFLAQSPDSPSSFPPSAYNLSPELQTALSQLPETLLSNNLTQRREGAKKNAESSNNTHLSAPRTEGSMRLCVMLLPFQSFTESELTDYMGRTVAESLQAVRELSGLSLPEITDENVKSSDNIENSTHGFLGRSFWAALARGGYQGAVYYIDNLEIRN